MKEKEKDAFARLLVIMDELREKCPWDRKQTMESLRNLTTEECYELTDAILTNNMSEVKEELGDLILHMVFYAKIADEEQAFDISDVLHGVCEKLIHRHPHIYGDVTVNNEEDVKKNWEQLKMKEGKKSVLSGVPTSLPALIKAQRMQEKTAQVGFEWENENDVWAKVEEEMQEYKEASKYKSKEEEELEFGDVLFSLVNFARFRGIDPETALEKVNIKFKKRFQYIEENSSKALEEMSLKEMDRLWEMAKNVKN